MGSWVVNFIGSQKRTNWKKNFLSAWFMLGQNYTKNCLYLKSIKHFNLDLQVITLIIKIIGKNMD